jgi:hypothetical protein
MLLSESVLHALLYTDDDVLGHQGDGVYENYSINGFQFASRLLLLCFRGLLIAGTRIRITLICFTRSRTQRQTGHRCYLGR